MADLVAHFAAAVDRFPNRTAIIDGNGQGITFRALQDRIRQLAGRWYAKGIRPGDPVLVAMSVNADLYASLAALWSLGATVVLPEPAMGLAGLRHAARTTRPKAFCTAGWFAALKVFVPELWMMRLLTPGDATNQSPAHKIRSDDVALISFTSGTTGQPKAIPRSHAFLMAQNDAVAPLLASDKDERDLVAFPVFTLINLAAGRTSVLPNWALSKLDRLSPAQIGDWIKAQKVTRALLPPSSCEKLADCDSMGQLHTLFTGGGPVFPDVVTRLQAEHQLAVTCVYGSTEAEPIAHLDATYISEKDHQHMAQGRGLLVGRPVPDISLRIRDHEIQVAGAHVNERYLNPAHSKDNKIRDGAVTWHRTGDAGTLDDQGRLWLWGRAGSQIETPSGLLFPFKIEVAARRWPGLVRCCLISTPGGPALCVQGDETHAARWQKAAAEFGVFHVIPVRTIPMDKRHASKVDRAALEKIIAG